MRILQLVTRRQYRGAEVFAANLSIGLLEKGHDVFFVGLLKPPEKPLVVNGAENIDLNGSGMSADPVLLFRLWRLIKNVKPDLIQANGSVTLKYAVWACIFYRKIPVVYRNISIISEWMGTNSLKRNFYKTLFKHVNFVTSVGEASRKDFIGIMEYPEHRIAVIRRGIPLTEVNRSEARKLVRESLGLSPECKVVIHAGSFTPEKNHAFILKVLKLIDPKNREFKVLFAGEGPLKNRTMDEARREGIDHNIIFLGYRQDTHLLFAAADVLVLFSTVEGVPGVVLEAGAQRCPSLAVNVGGTREVIDHMKTGILVDGHDEHEFAARLLEMIHNQHLLEQLGDNAYTKVCTGFSAVQMVNEFDSLYRRLTAEKK
jgi:L-malate glycosyltransferase